jgi:hypothetical protein
MKLICYCHNYTEAIIAGDFYRNNGRSTILAQIAKAHREKTCQ